VEILLISAAFAAVLGVAWYFSRDNRLRRELRKEPRRKIGAMPENERGRIVGSAHPFEGHVIEAPLTKRPCFYYVARVEIQKSNGKSTYWSTLIKEERGVQFVVRDDSGRAVVDPLGANVSLVVDSTTKSGTFDDPEENERAFLARHGQSGEGWIFNKGLRYHEAVIEENEVVAVLGSGVREPDPEAEPTEAYRGDQPTLLRLTSSPSHPLVISDASDTTQD